MLLSATICALIGATAGTTVGLIITWIVAGALPPASFTLGVATLMTLGTLAGSLPPVIRAARLDPVAILRVP